MIKLIGSGLILLSASLLGFAAATQIKGEKMMLEDLHGALIRIRSELQYRRPSVPELCQLLAQSLSPQTGKIFSRMEAYLVKGLRVRQAFSLALQEHNVQPEVVAIWEDLAESLTRLDTVQLDRVLDVSVSKMAQLCQNANNASRHTMRLCRVFGACLGGTLVILLL